MSVTWREAAAGSTSPGQTWPRANPALLATVLRFPYPPSRPRPEYKNAEIGIRYKGSRALSAFVISAAFHIAVLAAITAATRERGSAWASVARMPLVMQVKLASAPALPKVSLVEQAPLRPRGGVQHRTIAAHRVLSDVPSRAPVVLAAMPEPIAVATADAGSAKIRRSDANTEGPGASVQGPVPAPSSTNVPTAASTPASYVHSPKPEYPLAAREDEEEGIVVLRVHVSTQGLPTEVRVDRSSGFALLDRAAISAVGHWTFAAATVSGRRIESWMEVPIRFRLSDP